MGDPPAYSGTGPQVQELSHRTAVSRLLPKRVALLKHFPSGVFGENGRRNHTQTKIKPEALTPSAYLLSWLHLFVG